MVVNRWSADGGRTIYYVTANTWREAKKRMKAMSAVAEAFRSLSERIERAAADRWRVRKRAR